MTTDPKIDKAISVYDEIGDRSAALERRINGILDDVPAILEPLVAVAEALLKTYLWDEKALFDAIKPYLENPGNPKQMRETMKQWNEQVYLPLGEIASALDLSKHRTNIEWEGRAAEAYKALVPAQVGAVNGLKGAADRMALTLDAVANAVETFWVAITAALVSFAIALVSAAATLSPASLIAILTAIIAGVSAVLTFFVAAIPAALSAVQAANSQADMVNKTVEGLGTTWSKPDNGVDMSDGSDRDGDGSNWHARE